MEASADLTARPVINLRTFGGSAMVSDKEFDFLKKASIKIVSSGFSKRVIDETIKEAKESGASSDVLAIICNAIPMCE